MTQCKVETGLDINNNWVKVSICGRLPLIQDAIKEYEEKLEVLKQKELNSIIFKSVVQIKIKQLEEFIETLKSFV